MNLNLETKLRRFATVLADSNDAIAVIELDGRISAWNRGAEKMYGYSEPEALKMNIAKLIPKNKLKETEYLVQRLKAGETIESFETKRTTKDGKVLDVWMTITKLMDKTGNIISIATTERDITDRKKREEELENTIDALKSALDDIQILRGLLPICSQCKKIRDDNGYWEQIETYIEKHSKAQFTHSICPICVEELYPDLYQCTPEK